MTARRPRCSGVMTDAHTGADERAYRIGVLQDRVFCGPCADAAARLGLIDRRESPREPRR